ncbi:cytochrome d ubiquinol oxidase subunit II [Acidicapsa acidisoli]|uniref:cytochrome d ubiquinol oxidase subunit II n=1 Tax=Acidicapsa acidisoli TaxID=1615681 RepID=UPI0021DF9E46|nr:cytochrome d ubiquinol oxidase subunit II [Acidicapsa acidisoli]
MGTLWFWIIALMLAAYVVLDGFDLGVGIVYLFVAKTEQNRQLALRSIGPVWDGNEVWLLAAGGTLFFAFPLLYASAFSGFYLPLMMVIWLLILRAIGIEMRSHAHDAMGRSFFDAVFAFASLLLALFFGAALANVVRGVPLGPDNYFFLPLWTNWRTGAQPGILDWYTVIGGVLAVLALAMHGSLYLALKTEGDLEQHAFRWAGKLWPAVLLVTAISLPATVLARPNSLVNYRTHPLDFLAPLMVVLSLGVIRSAIRAGKALRGFLGSCVYLAAMLSGAAAGLYPVLLPSVGGAGQDLTVARAIASPHTLHIGMVWWTIGMLLALMYFSIMYWLFRGKVSQHSEGHGH